MNKIQLDDKIFLYKGNLQEDLLSHVSALESFLTYKNVWEISSKNNLNDTDLTINKPVLYLKTRTFNFADLLSVNNPQIQYNKELFKLKYKVDRYAFPFIKDYVDLLEVEIFGAKDWTVYSQKEETSFHDDIDRDGSKNKYTIIVALNDDYVGGEFLFKDRIGNDKIKLSYGDVLIYPSGYDYLHKEMEVTNGIKYCAVSYV